MTYHPEPFHNKYKSDVRLLYGLLLKENFGYDVEYFTITHSHERPLRPVVQSVYDLPMHDSS